MQKPEYDSSDDEDDEDDDNEYEYDDDDDVSPEEDEIEAEAEAPQVQQLGQCLRIQRRREPCMYLVHQSPQMQISIT